MDTGEGLSKDVAIPSPMWKYYFLYRCVVFWRSIWLQTSPPPSPTGIHLGIYSPSSYGKVFDIQRALSPVSSKKADPSIDLKTLEFTAWIPFLSFHRLKLNSPSRVNQREIIVNQDTEQRSRLPEFIGFILIKATVSWEPISQFANV